MHLRTPLLHLFLPLLLCLFPAWSPSAFAQNANLPEGPKQWAAAAVKDIQTAYTLTLENHPGMHDPLNPEFSANLQEALALGLKLAAKVNNAASYQAALHAFNARIHDGHAGLRVRLPATLQAARQWPGFTTVWRGQSLWVHQSSVAGVPPGAEILACDGRWIRDLIERNVFAFGAYGGRREEAGNWWDEAREVFLDMGNPFIARPQSCTLRLANRTKTLSLTWTELSKQGELWLSQANGESTVVGLSEPAPGLVWIALPSFATNPVQHAAYQALYTTLKTTPERWQQARAVVLDLRHNQGGSSYWSRQLANILWGEAEVESRMAAFHAKVSIHWRASAGNLQHVEDTLANFKRQGREHEIKDWIEVAQGMRAAMQTGQPLFVESGPTAPAPGKRANHTPAFNKPVYVVVPGSCGSACLDALDVFTRFDNTILVGAPSAGDSTYMEARYVTAPSGLARVVIPNKIWVGRTRRGGEGYFPAIELLTLDWNQQNFITLIERDLASKKP